MVIYPAYIGLKRWADELVGSYPEQFLPILQKEEDFEIWGAAVAGSGIFAKANVPAPFSISEGKRKKSFESWIDWAKIVYINVNYKMTKS